MENENMANVSVSENEMNRTVNENKNDLDLGGNDHDDAELESERVNEMESDFEDSGNVVVEVLLNVVETEP